MKLLLAAATVAAATAATPAFAGACSDMSGKTYTYSLKGVTKVSGVDTQHAAIGRFSITNGSGTANTYVNGPGGTKGFRSDTVTCDDGAGVPRLLFNGASGPWAVSFYTKANSDLVLMRFDLGAATGGQATTGEATVYTPPVVTGPPQSVCASLPGTTFGALQGQKAGKWTAHLDRYALNLAGTGTLNRITQQPGVSATSLAYTVTCSTFANSGGAGRLTLKDNVSGVALDYMVFYPANGSRAAMISQMPNSPFVGWLGK